MDTGVLVALITAGLAALGAIASAIWTSWSNARSRAAEASAAQALEGFRAQQAERDIRLRLDTERALAELNDRLARQSKAEDRELEARAVLDAYRRPLLAAADDLRGRITNLRRKGFAAYFDAEDHRAEVAKLGTLYRFAAYLGWIETMSRQLTYLQFETDEDTREVAAILSDIGRALTSDQMDRIDSVPRLMLWREEQRAIGGLMQRTDGVAGVIGFEAFVETYDGVFRRWLDPFSVDLMVPGAIRGDRLARVERSLNDLIRKLDAESVYTGKWRRRAASTTQE